MGDARGNQAEIENKYTCTRCDGTGEEPEAAELAMRELAELGQNYDAAEARIRKLEGALADCVLNMDFAEVFVNSRERIKRPEGSDLYSECLHQARAALQESEK